MTELCPLESRTPKWLLAYFGPNVFYLATFFEISTSNLFCPPFTLELMDKPIFKSIKFDLAILAHKNRQKS